MQFPLLKSYRALRVLLLLVLSSCFLSGCASQIWLFELGSPEGSRAMLQRPPSATKDSAAQKVREVEMPWYPEREAHHALVRQEMKRFSKLRYAFIRTGLRESTMYLDRLERVLVDFGISPKLSAVPMVESKFKSFARSRSGARGIWQFIPATAKAYGLKVSSRIDERVDPLRATVAAAHYLRDLYEQFGDWKLALAAYNTGPARVRRAIRRSGSRDFWVLSQRRLLPAQTRQYVPKVIAAALLMRDFRTDLL